MIECGERCTYKVIKQVPPNTSLTVFIICECARALIKSFNDIYELFMQTQCHLVNRVCTLYDAGILPLTFRIGSSRLWYHICTGN